MIKNRIWLTDEQRIEVVRRYAAGEQPEAIAASLGVCGNNIRNALRKAGVAIRDRVQARRRFSHDEHAFDTLAPEAEYWIGFLFADGSIVRMKTGSPNLSVGLAERDKGHLKKFRAFLRSEHSITTSKSDRGKFGTHVGVRYTLRSRPLADALFAHGMTSKSRERVASLALASSRDFWRGLVDGDGYISVSKNGKIRLGVCGGIELMNQFLIFLKEDRDIETVAEARMQGTLARVDLVAGTAHRAVRALYENARVALDRKNAIAGAILRGDIEAARRLRTVRKPETDAEREERIQRRQGL